MVSEDLVVGGIVIDENDDDDDVTLSCVVVSEDLVVRGVAVVDEYDDDDITLSCVVVTAGDSVSVMLGTAVVSVLACVVVAVARDVTEAQLQSVVVGSSGIACVVTVAAVVDGIVVESGQKSAPSSACA